ncbi:DUF3298 and DUF4163 domain-containing protein [Brevibacillus choshinensis]|uniref:DUF3298 and DUF4163 domain-containing protein n=1 Tax=Brevibacillus choshinensis TaxID=54911 RepID=UPI002E1D09B2|nr:DUF3298 and DUF4163 domain-containing protein [Brevibacillus choshinensis]MED4751473.1 DUF3298 and DUF4163 domain-containing protein [Brevibacillus choshinensis]
MKSFKSLAVNVISSAILLSAVAAPAFAATAAKPAAPTKPATPVVQVQKPQAKGVVITSKVIQQKTAEYEANISLPVISGLTDKAFEAKLNADILKLAQDELKARQVGGKQDAIDAKKYGYPVRPHAIDISYKVQSVGKLVAFSVQTYTYTGGAHGMTDVTFYNIANLDKAKNLQLSDLFQPGYDYRYVLNNLIKQQIQTNPEIKDMYNFETIAENQPFSFENGNLVIHFTQYEIAPYAAGMPSFTIPSRSFANLLKPDVKALLQ